jgi:hypothetical protein
MEETAVSMQPPQGGPRSLVAGDALAGVFGTWARHWVRLGAVSLVFLSPGLALQLAAAAVGEGQRADIGRSLGIGLLGLALGSLGSLLATTALTGAGLRAVRAEPLPFGLLVGLGIRRAWLVFKVQLVAYWPILLGAAVVGFGASTGNVGATVTLLVVVALISLGILAQVQPAVAAALDRPEEPARWAVLRTRRATVGHRRQILAVILVLGALEGAAGLAPWAARIWEQPPLTQVLATQVLPWLSAALVTPLWSLSRAVLHEALIGPPERTEQLAAVFE